MVAKLFRSVLWRCAHQHHKKIHSATSYARITFAKANGTPLASALCISGLKAGALRANLGKMLACQESDVAVLKDAVDGLYRLAPHERQLCHLASFFGAKKSNSLRATFDQWHSDGTYAWVFDNENDRSNLDPDVLGFDLSHILSDEQCKTPVLMYLTHRINQALFGKRGMLFCDEGWLALNDEYFRHLIDDWSRTPRKKNNFFGLATQVANDTINSSINKSFIKSFLNFFLCIKSLTNVLGDLQFLAWVQCDI